ncbi:DUF5753 domain-containing protein [Streptomyces microflavus]|uniref:DUF5753 domain-containing protein n=1 Tax=Streptomyces microflavus TaxID=1919 RepID=UPI0036E7D972
MGRHPLHVPGDVDGGPVPRPARGHRELQQEHAGPHQTEEYARAFLRCQEDLSPEQVEERVTARMSRQVRLRSDDPPFRWAVIDESVLLRPMGSRACMREQLASLLEQVDTPSSKTLLTLPDGTTVAYEEGIQAGHLYEDSAAVKKWRRQYDVLRANSLTLDESAERIRTAMEGYRP